MGATVRFELDGYTKVMVLNGSVPRIPLEIKKLVAQHIKAPEVDYMEGASVEDWVDSRLTVAGVQGLVIDWD